MNNRTPGFLRRLQREYIGNLRLTGASLWQSRRALKIRVLAEAATPLRRRVPWRRRGEAGGTTADAGLMATASLGIFLV